MLPVAERRRRIGFGAMPDDLITNLPIHLLICILDRMPINDAARTSILSKTWRNIWRSRSDVLLRYPFMTQLVSKKDKQSHQNIIGEAVDNILSAHQGPIIKFALYIPRDINLLYYHAYWMGLLSTKGVKHLSIANMRVNSHILMPSCFFSCSQLERLLLAKFRLDPPPNFQGFRNLTLVYLAYATFVADMSFGPQLNQLSLFYCYGIQHLASQFTHHNKNLNKFELVRSEPLEYHYARLFDRKDPISTMKECINLQSFLSSTPNVATLILNGFCLEFLDPEQAIQSRLTMTMKNMKTLILYDVEFYDLRQISKMLCLIRNSPNLQNLKISAEHKVKRTEPVELAADRYFKSLDCKKMVLEQLHTMEIGAAKNSKAEILFINYLRASSPSLKRLYSHSRPIYAECIKEFEYN